MGDDVFSTRYDGTINKFIVIYVNFYQMKSVCRRNLSDISSVENGHDYIFGKQRRDIFSHHLRIFFYDFIGYAQYIFTIKEVLPNLIILIPCGYCHYKAIGIQDNIHLYLR